MDYDRQMNKAGPPECDEDPPDSIYGGRWFKDDKDCRDMARFLWNLGKTHENNRMAWSVDPDLDKYMCKLIIHFRTKQLNTKPFPRLCTPYEEGERSVSGDVLQRQREAKVIWCRAPGLKIPGQTTWADTSTEYTKLHELVTVAKNKLPSELKKWTETLYDVSITYNSSLTPMHADDINLDGPGHVIQNICFNGDGVLLFAAEDNMNAEMEGCYFPLNSQLIFTNHLRYTNQHGLFRLEGKPVPLKWGKNPRTGDRIFVTLRWGKCPDSWAGIYKQLFPTDRPLPKPIQKPQPPSKALASKEKPRPKKPKMTDKLPSDTSQALPRKNNLAHSAVLGKPVSYSPYVCPGKPTLITNTNNAVSTPTMVYKTKWTIHSKKKFRLLNAAKVVEEFLVVRVGWYKHYSFSRSSICYLDGLFSYIDLF
jgi:hypothetical protein